MRRAVRLQLAFAWTCPDCGVRSYHEGVVPDLSDEEREDALRETTGAEPWQEAPEGDLMAMPDHVQCKCGSWFRTEEHT